MGIDTEFNEHKDYLERLCEDFEVRLKRMIDVSLEKDRVKSSSLDAHLFKEVLSHLLICQRRNLIFSGREELLEDVRQRFGLIFEWKDISEDGEEKDTLKSSLSMADMENRKSEMKEQEKAIEEGLKGQGVIYCRGDMDDDPETDPERNIYEGGYSAARNHYVQPAGDFIWGVRVREDCYNG